jgi:hypothetical protein
MLFTPEWIRKARAAPEAIIGAPDSPEHTLFAHKERSGHYTLCLDGRRHSLPRISIRELIAKTEGIQLSEVGRMKAGLLKFEYGVSKEDLDRDISYLGESHDLVSCWLPLRPPEGSAYRLVRRVMDKISKEEDGVERLGGIRLVSPEWAGSDYWAAEAEDTLSLKCLQQTLLCLGHKTAVVLAS